MAKCCERDLNGDGNCDKHPVCKHAGVVMTFGWVGPEIMENSMKCTSCGADLSDRLDNPVIFHPTNEKPL